MRNLNLLDAFRIRGPVVMNMWGWEGDDTCGAFSVKSSVDGGELKVIASSGEGWDHVSVSRRNRCPNWTEMEQIKHLFFREGETAMQLHVPASDHVNNHPYTLHMWRPLDQEIPRPPGIMVGIGSRPIASRSDAKALMEEALRKRHSPAE